MNISKQLDHAIDRQSRAAAELESYKSSLLGEVAETLKGKYGFAGISAYRNAHNFIVETERAFAEMIDRIVNKHAGGQFVGRVPMQSADRLKLWQAKTPDMLKHFYAVVERHMNSRGRDEREGLTHFKDDLTPRWQETRIINQPPVKVAPPQPTKNAAQIIKEQTEAAATPEPAKQPEPGKVQNEGAAQRVEEAAANIFGNADNSNQSRPAPKVKRKRDSKGRFKSGKRK